MGRGTWKHNMADSVFQFQIRSFRNWDRVLGLPPSGRAPGGYGLSLRCRHGVNECCTLLTNCSLVPVPNLDVGNFLLQGVGRCRRGSGLGTYLPSRGPCPHHGRSGRLALERKHIYVPRAVLEDTEPFSRSRLSLTDLGTRASCGTSTSIGR